MAKKSTARATVYNVPESWINFNLKSGNDKFTLTFDEYDENGNPTGQTCRVMGIPIERNGSDGNVIKTVRHAYDFTYDPQKKKRVLDMSKPLPGLCTIAFGYAEKSNGQPFSFYVKKSGEKESQLVPVADIVGMINNTLSGISMQEKRRLLYGDDTPAVTAPIPDAVEDENDVPYDEEDEGPTLDP